jgi:hypothetical protein
MKKSTHNYIVTNTESEGFFLILEFADDNPEFTSYIEYATNYSSLELAESVIDRVKSKGFTMTLQAKALITTYSY